MDDFCGDKDPYMESVNIKPLLQNAIVIIRERKFKVDRWFKGDNHCYIFIDIHPEGIPRPAFAAKPSQVSTAINEGRITIIKYGFEDFFDTDIA